jgi:hypothetical protein
LVDFLSVIVLVAAVELGVGILFAAFRRDRLSRAIVIALLILGTVIVLDVVAISTDFRDADGTFDCYGYCSTSQKIISWSLSVAALGLVALPIAVVLRELFRGRSH